MSDVAVFKVEVLTEGGFVTHAPKYSQFSETLDLAAKRLVVQCEAWAKALEKEIREQASLEIKEMKGQTPSSPAPRIILKA